MQETIVEEKGDVYFLQRGDGMVFACGELEAWNTLKNRSNWQRRDFTLIGTSDGSTYKKVISEAKKEKAAVQTLFNSEKAKLDRYKEMEEKMLYTDLLSDTDPKVIRVRELIEESIESLKPVEKKLQEFNSELIKRAFDAELEVARLTPRMPKNRNIEVGDSSRNRAEEVLRAMGRK